MTRGRHVDTCGRCHGPRIGNAWKGKLPVCPPCTLRRPGGVRCQRRCGPGGLVGPRCRLFGLHDPSECQPAGAVLRMHAVHDGKSAIGGTA